MSETEVVEVNKKQTPIRVLMEKYVQEPIKQTSPLTIEQMPQHTFGAHLYEKPKEYTIPLCPVCKSILITWLPMKYCYNCGQALEWGENNG